MKLALTFLALCLSLAVFAADDDLHVRATSVSVPEVGAELPPEAEEKIVRELVHMIHESIENEDPNAKGVRGLVKNWVGNLNFLEIGRNVYRYNASLGQTGPLKHLVPDILFMLGASHTIETTSALWGIPLAQSLGAPTSVQWLLGVVGGVISIPGLDPLCIGLMFTYSVSPRFRGVVSVGRVGVFRTAHFLGRVSGVNGLFHHFFEKGDRLEHVLDTLQRRGTRDHTVRFEAGERPELRFENGKGEVVLTLRFRRKGERGWMLETMGWKRGDPSVLEVLREPVFSKLGWNVRSMVRKVLKRDRRDTLDFLRERFYVDSLVTEESRGRVRFVEGAIDMTPRWKRRTQEEAPRAACSQVFGKLGS